jgi:hypothetical protein
MAAITQLIPGTRPGDVFGEFRVFADNPSVDGDLNLYTNGTAFPYGVLNLALIGAYAEQNGSLNLVLYNNATVGSLNLYVSGQGGEPGATPIYGSLPLYIECPIGNFLNLYTSGEDLPSDPGRRTMLVAWGGPGQEYGDFTQGTYYGLGSLNLSIYSVSADYSGSLNLYTHGF